MDKKAPLVDSFGRVATDLRISVTDRCNFRCRYCMPAEGLDWLPKDELLTFEEIERLTRILVGCGIRSLKITGGEPLVRRDLPRLIAMLRGVHPALDISLTTNGYSLAQHAAALADAGMDPYPLELAVDGVAPATSYRFADGAPGNVGVIPSVTEPFCESCDRLRLTSGRAGIPGTNVRRRQTGRPPHRTSRLRKAVAFHVADRRVTWPRSRRT